MSSFTYRIAELKELRGVLSFLARGKRYIFERLQFLGFRRPIMLAVSTEGGGLIGERYPLNLANIVALIRLSTIIEILSQYASKEDMAFFDKILRSIETTIFWRSYRRDTLMAPYSEVFSKLEETIRTGRETIDFWEKQEVPEIEEEEEKEESEEEEELEL